MQTIIESTFKNFVAETIAPIPSSIFTKQDVISLLTAMKESLVVATKDANPSAKIDIELFIEYLTDSMYDASGVDILRNYDLEMCGHEVELTDITFDRDSLKSIFREVCVDYLPAN